ncbi:MAG: alpha/beta fold hydrolase [Pirellulaceae bacterium]
MNEREIFLAALQIEDPEERSLFLDRICESKDLVRKRLNQLLEAHSKSQNAVDRVAAFIAGEVSSGNSNSTEENAATEETSHALLQKALGEVFKSPDKGLVKPGKKASVPTGTQLAHYQIVERIGYGGMGEVYLARDTKLDRRVALKLLAASRDNDTNWLQHFRREAKLVGGLNHPNVLTIHEIGETGGVHFLATEFVDGITLRQKIAAGRSTITEVVDYALQISRALIAAHAANIIHRDLKPANLMVRKDGLLKVLDFGLAKSVAIHDGSDHATDSHHFSSNPGLVIGTVAYMSPEQARGKSLDTRTDIFSLGVVLYELLTGEIPFPGETATDILAAILEREPKPIHELRPEVPVDLAKLVVKCLKKVREQRYTSASALLHDLERCAFSVASDQNPQAPTKVHPDARAYEHESDDIPIVRYARSGNLNIAYQVLGEGTIDLVFVMGWVSHLEMFWKEPSFARFLRRLATFARLIIFDKRGTGLSDKVPIDQLPTLEQRMDDVRAVMDAAGSKRAVLCGISEGGPMCTLFAATYPEKTIALTMIGSYARRLWAPDYPWGPTDEHREHFFEEMRRDWGGPVGIDDRAPSKASDPQFRNWWASYLRMGASPGAALALTQMNAQIDIRPILSSIQVPTLVIHRTRDRCLVVEEGRFLAEQIPGAKFVELPGEDHLPFVGDQDAILGEIEEFLTGVRDAPLVDRVLATVLFIQFEGQSESHNEGVHLSKSDKRFQSHVAREAELFKGRNVSFRANSAVVAFDGPARAVRAGIAINETAKRLGISLQTGVHTGECDLVNGQVNGTAVEFAELVARSCPAGDTLVSSTVKDLVVGSGLRFESHSTINLPKQLGELHLFRAQR